MNRISLIIKQRMLSIIFIIIAVIGGILVFWYVSNLKTKIPEDTGYNQIFIAKTDIKKDEEITGELIEAQKIPGNIFSEKFIMDEDKISSGKYDELLLNAFRSDIVFGLEDEREEIYD